MNYLHLIIWAFYSVYSIVTYFSLDEALNGEHERGHEGWDLLVNGKLALERDYGIVFKSVKDYAQSIFKTQLLFTGIGCVILSGLVVFFNSLSYTY